MTRSWLMQRGAAGLVLLVGLAVGLVVALALPDARCAQAAVCSGADEAGVNGTFYVKADTSFKGTFTHANTADRIYTSPDVTTTLAGLAATSTWVAQQTFPSPILTGSAILDQATGDYTLTWADPAAARAISIPDPGGTDVLVFRDMTQTLAGKTLTSPVITTSPNAAGSTWIDLGSVTTADINGGTGDAFTLGDGVPAPATVTEFAATSTVAFQGDISPAQITADQNNYSPTGLSTATVLRLSTDASRTLTGLAGGADGRVITLLNIGSFDLTLAGSSGSSSAANQFAHTGSYTIRATGSLTLIYDSTSSRWRVVGASGPGFQRFTASGTWTKPSGIQGARVQAIGAGGGGGAGDRTALTGGGGGGGGAFIEATFAAEDLGATETVTIGAGGAQSTAGGNSSFGSLTTAYGGGGGAATTFTGGGGGAGSRGAGANGSGGTGGAAGAGVASGAGGAGGNSSAVGNDSENGGAGGGGGANATDSNGVVGGSATRGGGGGGGGAANTGGGNKVGGAGGPSLQNGGGAGGTVAIGDVGQPGGSSTTGVGGGGGGGGATSVGRNGGAGGTPGGGGGGGGGAGSNEGVGGVGARGELRIWWW